MKTITHVIRNRVCVCVCVYVCAGQFIHPTESLLSEGHRARKQIIDRHVILYL